MNPWIRNDLENFNTVHIDDYLEYILERCLQPREAVEQSNGDAISLVEAVHEKIHAALTQGQHKEKLKRIHESLKN